MGNDFEAELEKEPRYAAELFGNQIDLARAFTLRLAKDSETYGLLGPRELSKIWSRHVINSALLAELIPSGVSVVDVGSGAGLPGIPMAIAKPDAHFTLVEPMERRANWLKAVIQDLKIPNIEVIRARAEEVTKHNFDYATARAVAPFDKLLKLMSPLISDSTKGTVIALKGSKAQQEIEEAGKILAKFGYSDPEVLILGSGKAPETATVVRTFLK